MKQNSVKLTDLKGEEIKQFRTKYDVIICDVDGTIYRKPSGPIPGAQETISTLHANGKELMVLTDNCVRTRERAFSNFHGMFPEFKWKNFITSGWLLTKHMKKIGLKGKIYVIGVEGGIIEELKNAGFEVVYDKFEQMTLERCLELEVEAGVTAVVLGIDPNYCFYKIMKAINHLSKPTVHFFVTQKCIITQLKMMPGGASLVLPIQACTGREPVYCGKGSQMSVDYIHSLGYDMKRCLLVGDMYETDIVCGNMCGMDTLFVGSGSLNQPTLDEIMKKNDPLLVPTYHADSIADLGRLFTESI